MNAACWSVRWFRAAVACGAAVAAKQSHRASQRRRGRVAAQVNPLRLVFRGRHRPRFPQRRHINGTINTTPDILIQGWYCPSTGRIHFVHKNLNSGIAMRIFTGNVSDDVIGQPLHVAETMTVLNTFFGDLGEYNFSATR